MFDGPKFSAQKKLGLFKLVQFDKVSSAELTLTDLIFCEKNASSLQ